MWDVGLRLSDYTVNSEMPACLFEVWTAALACVACWFAHFLPFAFFLPSTPLLRTSMFVSVSLKCCKRATRAAAKQAKQQGKKQGARSPDSSASPTKSKSTSQTSAIRRDKTRQDKTRQGKARRRRQGEAKQKQKQKQSVPSSVLMQFSCSSPVLS